MVEVTIKARRNGPYKVEGLAVVEEDPEGLRLLAVVDADDATAASSLLTLRLEW